jgi:multidrug efflux pump subunit AcrB
MPVAIEPPIVVQFNASSVPVLQISLSSNSLTEAQLYDYDIYNLRQRLAPIHGVTLPTQTGEKYRQIMVDIDPAKLLAQGLAPIHVVNAVNAQNLSLPSGTAKIGDTQFVVQTTPYRRRSTNSMPSRSNAATAPRYSCVISALCATATPSSRIWCVKAEFARYCSASLRIKRRQRLTWSTAVKNALGVACAAAPPGLQISELFDQSVFVVSSVMGVLREGAIAAGLTALMILVFLGSWRPTLATSFCHRTSPPSG